MTECALCKKSPADKKGSHIVPHFLLKRIENIQGKKGRGYELGFSIQGMFTSSHFGESVLPEKLEQIYGEVTDEDIANTRHPLIVDNIFCTACEKRLSVIENEYSKTIDKTSGDIYESGILASLGMLFWGSVIWRMSIHGKSGVILKDSDNEKLRTLIDEFLPDKIDNFEELEMNKSEIAKTITYKLTRCINDEKDNPKWLLFHPAFNDPLCLLIDEYVIAFAITNNYSNLEIKDCFGINEKIKLSEKNSLGTNEKITPFDLKQYQQIGVEILKKIKEKYLDDLSEYCNEIHVLAGGHGKTMPIELKNKILKKITSGETKLGRRYSVTELSKVISNAMQNYNPRTL